MRILLCILVILSFSLIVNPALAFTSDTLTVDIREDGGATVFFTYTLNWFERFAVFLQIADPARELRNAVEGFTGQPVTVTEVTGSSVVFSVDHFARLTEEGGVRIYRTPELEFPQAGGVLRKYWFAPFVQADFSPEVAIVRFPDGYEESWRGVEYIPSLSHRETAVTMKVS